MLETYIKDSWTLLRRNTLDVALDPQTQHGARTFLYIPACEDPAAINALIAQRRKTTEQNGAIEVRVLPEDLSVQDDHGILYLPHDYVVPGGRFNEMYAWDSYWIIEGLLQDGHADIARGIVQNFIYQIRHYGGKILNANRTYYLSRSQPPMLGSMALAVLPTIKEEDQIVFLRDVADAIELEYEGFWKKSRFDTERGLFRYGNLEQGVLGLCPEVVFGESDEKGHAHYDLIVGYLRDLPAGDGLRLRFYDEQTNSLTPEAIAGDRAMRESGFDASMQMGIFGLETIDFDPVCLNSLLYSQCQILAYFYKKLDEPEKAHHFHSEAIELSSNIQKFLWNEETKTFWQLQHLSQQDFQFYLHNMCLSLVERSSHCRTG